MDDARVYMPILGKGDSAPTVTGGASPLLVTWVGGGAMAETLILAVTSVEPRILALKSGPPALIPGNT